MAVNLVSPGVNIREVDLTLGRIDQSNEQIGALVGPFEKGPINTPILINNEQELIKIFGKPKVEDEQNEYWYSASNYLTYGGKLRVIRVGDETSQSGRLYNANVGVVNISVELRIFNSEDFELNHSNATEWYYSAKTPGSWANDLKVCVIDNFADQTISGVSTSELQVGFAVTQYSSGGAVTGTNIRQYGGYLRGLITGIGNSEFYVKVQDLYETNEIFLSEEEGFQQNPEFIPVNYIKTGLNVESPFAFRSGADAELDFYVQDSSGNLVTTISIDGGVNLTDWYDTQTLGLENSNIFWRSIAPKPGTSQYVGERGGKNDELHVVIVDETGTVTGTSGNIVEKYINLSKASDAKISPSRNIFYREFIDNISEFIYIGANEDGVASGLSAVGPNSKEYILKSAEFGNVAQNNSFDVIGKKTYSLSGGTDYSGGFFIKGYEALPSEILSGYELLSNPVEYNINYLIGGPFTGTSELEAQAKANTIISVAEQRKDCIAVLSPYKNAILNTTNSSAQTSNILRFFSPITSSSYAVLDSGYKYTFDRFNNKFFYMACNSDVAGLMARTSINNQPWFSPAGSVRGNLNNVVKLAYNPSKDQRDQLYTNRINPIIANSGLGFILFGDKTALSYPSAFDRINVRKLFLTLEKSIEQAARAQLFEFNDAITRTNFINIVEPYLRDVRAKRGITEFLIVCDESNNTPDVIDANQFKADIFIKPARSINFVGLTFVATRTGVSFSEVLGTV
jgi:hypothetical protein